MSLQLAYGGGGGGGGEGGSMSGPGSTAVLDYKDSVMTVATVNITLSGLQAINGYTLLDGDRVGVVSQTNPEENGIYIASTIAWERSSDADSDEDVTNGLTFLISNTGSNRNGSRFTLVTQNPIELNTTSLVFEEASLSAAGTVQGQIAYWDTTADKYLPAPIADLVYDSSEGHLRVGGNSLYVGDVHLYQVGGCLATRDFHAHGIDEEAGIFKMKVGTAPVGHEEEDHVHLWTDTTGNLWIRKEDEKDYAIPQADENGNIRIAADLWVDEYIEHTNDSNTSIRFQTDKITVKAGNKIVFTADEDNTSTLEFGSAYDTDFNSGALFIGGVEGSANGKIGIGTKTPTLQIEAVKTGSANVMALRSFHNHATETNALFFHKARGTEEVSNSTQIDDVIGNLSFSGYGSNGFFAVGAEIKVIQKLAAGSTNTPSAIGLYTSFSGGGSASLRFEVGHDGVLFIQDVASVPTGSIGSGARLYSTGGVLHFRSAGGTDYDLSGSGGGPDLASQAEAEAGTENSKYMSPLRTSQAIDALGGEGGGYSLVRDFTYGEDIDAGEVVRIVVDSGTKVKKVITQLDALPTVIGAATEYAPGGTHNMVNASPYAEGKTIMFGQFDGSVRTIMATRVGNDIEYDPSFVIETGSCNKQTAISIPGDPTSAFYGYTRSNNEMSWRTLAIDAEGDFSAGTPSTRTRLFTVNGEVVPVFCGDHPTSGKWVILMTAKTTSQYTKLYAYRVQPNGVATLEDTYDNFDTYNSSMVGIDAAYIGNNKAVISYTPASNPRIYVRVVEMVGSTITVGAYAIPDAGSGVNYSKIVSVKDDQFIVQYRRTNNSARYYRVGTVTDMTITWPGAEGDLPIDPTVYGDFLKMEAISSTKFAVVYKNTAGDDRPTIMMGVVDGDDVTLGDPFVYMDSESYYPAVAASGSNTMMVFSSLSTPTRGEGVMLSASGTEGELQDAVGIAQETATEGQTGSIALIGAISTETPGTPGVPQFLDSEGILTENTTPYPIGRSIDSDKFLVTKQALNLDPVEDVMVLLGGNENGADLSIGTIDNYDVSFKRNNIDKLTLEEDRITATSSIIPVPGYSLDLGTSVNPWRDLYIDRSLYLYSEMHTSSSFALLDGFSRNRFILGELVTRLYSGDESDPTTLSLESDRVSVSEQFLPDSTNTLDLGSSSLRWKDLHLQGNILSDASFAIHDGTRNRINFTSSTTYLYSPNGSNYLYINNTDVQVKGHFLPQADTYNLGSSSKPWNDGFISGTIEFEGIYTETTTGSANVNIGGDTVMKRSTSSRKIKKDIRYDAVDPGLTLQLQPVLFTGKLDDIDYMGLIAEDVRDIDPRFATDDPELPGLEINALISALISTIKDLNKRIDILESIGN